MKIQDFFDTGYFINLDRRKDRLDHITTTLNNMNILDFCKRVPAEDSIVEPDPIKKHHYCSLSHHKIYDDAIKNQFSKVVIFEDDFNLYDTTEYDSLKNIENGLEQLSNIPDWDIVYFGGYIFDKEIKKVSTNLLKVDTILTTHGYGISKSGLAKLKRHVPFQDCQIDGWIGQRTYINKYVIYPFSSYQLQSPSDLDARGETPGIQHWKNLYISPEKVIV